MMQSTQANNKRREKDVMKLIMSGKFDVQLVNEESTQEFDVLFEGPADSHYEGVSLRKELKVKAINMAIEKQINKLNWMITILTNYFQLI